MTYTVKGAYLAKAKLTSMCELYPTAATQVLGALQQLQSEGPVSLKAGICSNMSAKLPVGYFAGPVYSGEWLVLIFMTWEYWTGSHNYPVPAGRGDLCPISAWEMYDRRGSAGDMWAEGTEYGGLRRELLAHCITTLQEAIEHASQ